MLFQPDTPIIARIIEQPAPGTTLGEIITWAIGLAGALLVGAALLGLVLGGLLIGFRKLRPDNAFNGEESKQVTLKLNSQSR